jgi:tetratricopeptide (TPR) repeat protein
MAIKMDNGVALNSKTIKSILLNIFENKPTFPIEDKDILIEALGGKDRMYYINEEVGELPVSTLAEKSFKNKENIQEPSQIIDSIIGDSFVNIVTKSKLLEKISKLKYPIESKDKLTSKIKDLILFGIPVELVAKKLDYPINKPEQIINHLKLLDKKLLEANLQQIYDLSQFELPVVKKGPPSKGPVVETKTVEKVPAGKIEPPVLSEELSLKEKIKRIIELGKNAYREKEYERAILIYDEGLALDADNTELRFLKKTVQAKIKDLETGQEDETTVEESKTEPTSEPSKPPPETQPPTPEAKPTEMPGVESSEKEAVFDKSSIDKAPEIELVGNEAKIEELEKKLQEKVKVLKDLAKPMKDIPEDACKSCEGTGECYWCKGNGKCNTCSGTGKTEAGEPCTGCHGSGDCHSCQGTGKCRWCSGSGKKEDDQE